jgi:hypothetical protein
VALLAPMLLPATAGADYRAAVMADTPSGYWRLDETSGTAAADASGNGNAGTYAGGVTLNEPGPSPARTPPRGSTASTTASPFRIRTRSTCPPR